MSVESAATGSSRRSRARTPMTLTAHLDWWRRRPTARDRVRQLASNA
jgi:hypothetical protein